MKASGTIKKVICALVLAAVTGGGIFAVYTLNINRIYRNAPAPELTAGDFAEKLCSLELDAASEYLDIPLSGELGGEVGTATAEAIQQHRTYEITGLERNGKNASVTLTLGWLDAKALHAGLEHEMQPILAARVSEAVRSDEIYDENLNFLRDAAEEAFYESLDARLADIDGYLQSAELILNMETDGEVWTIFSNDALTAAVREMTQACDVVTQESFDEAYSKLEYVRKHYELPNGAGSAAAPDKSCYGETDDPAVIEALIETPIARQLIEGQQLAWNADIELLPDSVIHYYLDETILVIVWQEVTARAVGTYAEVIIADASQFGRKLMSDKFGEGKFLVATKLARQANAVLASGGDYYAHPSRRNGICVYEGEVCRFEPDTSDSCFFTTSGDMMFAYRHQFTTKEEAQKFVDENDISFSVCFGPVLIDNGEDVMPNFYPWGEINDEYARSAIGQLGERHYLILNINCQKPNNYYLATLRSAADAMIAKGCKNAYTLDGGQTACIILDNELMNAVQFGYERLTSDIIFFASAMPGE